MKNKLTKQMLFIFTALLFTACTPTPANLAENTPDKLSPQKETLSIPTAISIATSTKKTLPISVPTATPTEVLISTATFTAELIFEIITSPMLTQIEMLDEQNGWGQAEGTVLRTEDGGETWLNVTPSDMQNDSAYAKSVFLDEETGWIFLEDYENPGVGILYKTTDGGANWHWRNTPFGRSALGLIDQEKGYAMEDLGAGAGSMGVAIWTTSNGGDDFNRTFLHKPGFNDSLPLSGIKSGISFRDPQNGWVTGSQPQNSFIWLYRTRDGGFSWVHQELTMPQGYEEAQTSAYAPLFFDHGLGLLPIHLHSEESATVFYRTTDSGETWTATFPVPVRGKYSVASANEIILWDGTSLVYTSSDGGKSWKSNAPNWHPGDTLRELDFVSLTRGWALTEEGLYRTEDSGQIWEQLGE